MTPYLLEVRSENALGSANAQKRCFFKSTKNVRAKKKKRAFTYGRFWRGHFPCKLTMRAALIILQLECNLAMHHQRPMMIYDRGGKWERREWGLGRGRRMDLNWMHISSPLLLHKRYRPIFGAKFWSNNKKKHNKNSETTNNQQTTIQTSKYTSKAKWKLLPPTSDSKMHPPVRRKRRGPHFPLARSPLSIPGIIKWDTGQGAWWVRGEGRRVWTKGE